VELLLMKPMRIGNLAGLDLERNILRTRSRGRGLVHLVVSDKEVKNAVRIEAVLPSVTVKLLDLYIERYRPLLMRCPSSFLFPNTSGGPKSRNMLGLQITKFVRRECGLQVNAHLFRHIGAAHYLNNHPGEYGLVQLVLGHTSEETTKRAYCGTETAAAMRHFDEHVLRLRAEAPPLSKRKARRTRRTG
jgi:integrase